MGTMSKSKASLKERVKTLAKIHFGENRSFKQFSIELDTMFNIYVDDGK